MKAVFLMSSFRTNVRNLQNTEFSSQYQAIKLKISLPDGRQVAL